MFHGEGVSFGDFDRMLKNNGYSKLRSKGSHTIYCNRDGNKITVNSHLNKMVARRLIKENNLDAGNLKGILRL